MYIELLSRISSLQFGRIRASSVVVRELSNDAEVQFLRISQFALDVKTMASKVTSPINAPVRVCSLGHSSEE